jgi:hypothetical protein
MNSVVSVDWCENAEAVTRAANSKLVTDLLEAKSFIIRKAISKPTLVSAVADSVINIARGSLVATSVGVFIGGVWYLYARERWWPSHAAEERASILLSDDVGGHEDAIGIEDLMESLPADPTYNAAPGQVAERTVLARRRSQFVAYCIRKTKFKFGLLRRTEANRLMVRKFVVDIMVERGVRDSHIYNQVDDVTELTFVPNEADVIRAEMRSAHQVVEMEYQAHRPYEAPRSWWQWLTQRDRVRSVAFVDH